MCDPNDLGPELWPARESLAEFVRAEESKGDCGVRVMIIDEVEYKLPIEISSTMDRTEQLARCSTCIVKVTKCLAKVERVRARKIDIPHEGVSQLLRLDAKARDPTSSVRLIQSPAVCEASDKVSDLGLR